MATVHYSALPTWSSAPTDPDASVPIGSLPLAASASATRCSLDGDAVIYTEEVPLIVLRARPVELRVDQRRGVPDPPPVRSWFALVAKTKDATLSGETFVFATHPYSSDWFGEDCFKGACKKGPIYVDRRKREAIDCPDGHHAFLKRLPYDLFETRGGWWTATIAEPGRAGAEVATGRKYMDLVAVLGICADPDGCRRALHASTLVQELVDRTIDGSLFLHFHARHPLALSRPLHPAAQEHFAAVLDAAMSKAMAGPPDDSEAWRLPRGDSGTVARATMYIYLEMMDALSKRLERAAPPAVERSELRQERRAWGADEFDAAVRRCTESLADIDLRDGTAKQLESALLRSLADADLRLEACALAVAMHLRVGLRPETAWELAELAREAEASVAHWARLALERLEQR